MKIIFTLIITASSLSSLSSFASESVPLVDLTKLKALPKLPVLAFGCEGECCGILRTKKVLIEIPIFEWPNKSSKKIGVAKRGEALESAKFFTKILKFGKTNVNGKNLTVLSYIGEGNSTVWDGKKVLATDCYGGNDTCGTYEEAQTESWVQVITKTGLRGWANLHPKSGQELEYDGCG